MDSGPQNSILSSSSMIAPGIPESQQNESKLTPLPPTVFSKISGNMTSIAPSHSSSEVLSAKAVASNSLHTTSPQLTFATTEHPPKTSGAVRDSSSAMDNNMHHTQVTNANMRESSVPQKEMDNPDSKPQSGTYASSSSDLSSISTNSIPESLTAAGSHDKISKPEDNLSPVKSGLTLKLSFGPKLRTIAPAVASSSSSSTVVAEPSISNNNNNSSSPSKLQQASSSARRGKGGPKRRKLRKSGKHTDGGDGVAKAEDSTSEGEPTPSTTQTKSGRQIHRPRVYTPQEKPTSSHSPDAQPPRKRKRVYRKGKEVNVTCLHCDRGHSPESNVIVFCDECNGAWHQFCHDPLIEAEVISVKEKEWLCKECRPVPTPLNLISQAKSRTSSKYKKTPPSSSPSSAYTNKPSNILVGGSQFTHAQRLGYLTALSHADLARLLYDISNSKPDLPVFPSNLQELPSSSFIPTNTTSTTADDDTSSTDVDKTPVKSPTGKAATSEDPSEATAAPPKYNNTNIPSMEPSPTQHHTFANPLLNDEKEDEDDDSEDDELEEHRLYPRAGNGFRLPPDSEDLDMLLEDPACTTFSHSLHGPAKAMAEASILQMVGVVA